MDNNKRWLSSGYLRAAISGEINYEKGFINGVSVCTTGETKGYGVNLDNEFIETVCKFGNDKKQGLKARFGHPNMCSTALGTFLGRFKNFSVKGNQVFADLFLSNEAKNTPHGNLYEYVLGMAKNEPDMFGTSIAFTPGAEYKKDADGNKYFSGDPKFDELEDKIFVECLELHACDTVDDPAANDGLFSRFSNETVAGQITEFLDLNPSIFEALNSTPAIIQSLAKYPGKIDEFIQNYETYKKKNGESKMKRKPNSEQLEAQENAAAEVVTPAETAPEPAPAEPVATEPQAETENKPADVQTEAKTIDAVEFESLVKEFGADIAAKIALSNGGMTEAYKLQSEALKAENDELKTKLGTPVIDGGEPAKLSSEVTNKKSIWSK